MRRLRVRPTAALVALIVLAAAPALAEVRPGIRASAWLEDSDPGVGVDLLVPLGPQDWSFNPNLEAVFADRDDRFLANFDFLWHFLRDGQTTFWTGGGLAVIHHDDPPRGDDDTEGGLNLLAGAGWGNRGFQPYVQLKAVLADDSELVASFGVRF